MAPRILSDDEFFATKPATSPTKKKLLTDEEFLGDGAGDEGMSFTDSAKRGTDLAQSMGYGAAEVAGELFGADGLTEFGREGRERNLEEAAQYGERSTLSDIEDLGDFGQWAKETAGEQIPMMAPSMVGGAAGAALGTLGGPAAPITVPLGAAIGAFIPSLVMGTGEVQGAIKEKDPEAKAPGMALAGGSFIAALDTVLPGRVGSRLARSFGLDTAEEIAKRALEKPVKDTWMRAGLKEGGKSMAIEGVTESLQEAIGEVTAAAATGTPIDTAGLIDQMKEAGAAGMLMGGGTGFTTEAISTPAKNRKIDAATEMRAQQEAAAENSRQAEIARLDAALDQRLAEMDAEASGANAPPAPAPPNPTMIVTPEGAVPPGAAARAQAQAQAARVARFVTDVNRPGMSASFAQFQKITGIKARGEARAALAGLQSRGMIQIDDVGQIRGVNPQNTPASLSSRQADGGAGSAAVGVPQAARPAPPAQPPEVDRRASTIVDALRAQGWGDEEIVGYANDLTSGKEQTSPAARADAAAIMNLVGRPPQQPQQAAQPGAEVAGTADEQTVPESDATLLEQQKALMERRVAAQMFPTGTRELPVPEGMKRVETPRGVFHFNPSVIQAPAIRRASAAGRENEILGLGPLSKQDIVSSGERPVAVVERTPAGVEVRAAAAIPSSVDQTMAVMQAAAAPGNTVQVENPDAVLQGRKLAGESSSEGGSPDERGGTREVAPANQPNTTGSRKLLTDSEFLGDNQENVGEKGDGTRAAPVKVESAADLDRVRDVVNQDATDGQKGAGNYQKAHISWYGLKVAIETPRGGTRRSKASDPNKWEVPNFPTDYGYFKGTEDRTGEEVDVHVGTNPASRLVFVIDQRNLETGKYDEPKVMIGFPGQTAAEQKRAAIKAYTEGFSDGRGEDRIGAVTEMDVGKLKKWLKSRDAKKPAGKFRSLAQRDQARKLGKDMAARPVEGEFGADAITFLASRGGIRDDEGHGLKARRNLQKNTQKGWLIRDTGMSIDAAGEALWEAGYFGPVEAVPRPTENEVLNFIEKAFKTKTYIPSMQFDKADENRAGEEKARHKAALAALKAEAKADGFNAFTDEEIARAAELMAADPNLDAADALEQVVTLLEREAQGDQFVALSEDDFYGQDPFALEEAQPREARREAGSRREDEDAPGDEASAPAPGDESPGRGSPQEEAREEERVASAADVDYLLRALKGKHKTSPFLRGIVYFSPYRPLGSTSRLFQKLGGKYAADKHTSDDHKSKLISFDAPISLADIAAFELVPVTSEAKLAAMKEAYAATPGAKAGRWVFRDPESDNGRGRSVTKSAKESGQYQLTWFDATGFSGDTSYNTEDEAISAAMANGYEPAPTHLQDMMAGDDFKDPDEHKAEAARLIESPKAEEPKANSRPTASWVVKNKETGEVLFETFDRKKVDALNTEKYEAVPTQEHLASLNKKPETPAANAPLAANPDWSPEYAAAMEKSSAASAKFKIAQDAYRAKLIDDNAFIAAKKEHDAAMAEFDEAFAKERDKPKPKTEKVQTVDGKRDQFVMPGAEQSAKQASQARGERIKPKATQKDADEGLFDTGARDQGDIFDIKDGNPNAGAKSTGASVDEKYSAASNAAPFFSALTRGVENAGQTKAPADQWAGIIDNLKTKAGVKAEEIEWSGVKEWLATQTGSVSKDSVVAFLKANEIKVEESTKGNDPASEQYSKTFDEYREEWYRHYGDEIDGNSVTMIAEGQGEHLFPAPPSEELTELGDRLRTAWGANRRGRNAGTATKFQKHVLPGGENYRELLLTMPAADKPDVDALKEAKRASLSDFVDQFMKDAGLEHFRALGIVTDALAGAPGPLNTVRQAMGTDVANGYIERRRAADKAHQDAINGRFEKTYRGGHFEEPNILVHVRFNERTDADGKRVLFIEEIQSDWHQKGRKEGYADPKMKEKVAAIDKRIAEIEAAADPDRDAPRKTIEEWTDLKHERQRIIKQGTNGVPDAPFKTTWQELAFKRALRWAVENGFDRVAWTTGEQQADRYDLSKQVKEIEYEKRPTSESGGAEHYKLSITALNGDDVTPNMGWMTLSEIEDTVGKEIAEKIQKGEGRKYRGHDGTTLEGLDLKVGGKGMAGFYDKIVPSFVSKYVKKWGAKVGQTKIATDDKMETGWTVLDESGEVMQSGYQTMREADEALRNLYYGNGFVRPPADGKATDAVHSVDITPAMRDSVMQGQPLFRGNTDDFKPGIDRKEVETQVRKIVAEVSGGRANPVFEETIYGDGEAMEASGGGRDRQKAAGSYNPLTRLIRVAMAGYADPIKSGLHEVFHDLQAWGTFDPSERRALDTSVDKMKAIARKEGLAVDGMSQNELEAVAFAHVERLRMDGKGNSGFIPGVLRAFAKVRTILDRVKRFATGKGWKTMEDVFRDARSGKIAARGDRSARPNDTEAFSGNETTKTAAFKKWFGDSKMVDKSGKPLVVYHGTAADFDAFDPARIGSNFGNDKAGFSFTNNPGGDMASGYATMQGSRHNGNVMPVYLSMQNPFTLEDWGRDFGYGDSAREILDGRSVVAWYDAHKGGFIDQIQKDGYDSVLIKDPDMNIKGEPEILAIVFRPEQIKSVFNRGTFDPKDKRISYSADVEKIDTVDGEMDHYVVPGAERSDAQARASMSARQKADMELRTKQSKMRTAKPQKGAGGMFGDEGGSQGTLFSVSTLEKEAAARGPKPKEDIRSSEVQGISKRIRQNTDAVPVMQQVRKSIREFKEVGAKRVIQGIADSFYAVSELERSQNAGQLHDASTSAYKAVRMTQNLNSVMSFILRHGPIQLKDGAFQPLEGDRFKGGFEAIFEPVIKAGEMELFKDWIIAQRAGRLLAEGRENLLTADEIAAIKAEVDKSSARLERFTGAFQKYQEFNRAMLDMAVAAGRVSAKQAELWTKNGDYVPFYRLMEGEDQSDSAPRKTGGLSQSGPLSKRLKGGAQQIGDPIENMVMNMTAIVDKAMKNEALRRVVDLAVDAGMMAKAEEAENLTYSAEKITEMLADNGVNLESLPQAEQDKWIKMLSAMIQPPGNAVTLWRDGKPERYHVYDPLLLSAISAMSPAQLGSLMKMMRGAKRLLTEGVTMSPAFMAANLIRDTLSSWAISGQKGHNPFVAAPKGLLKAWKQDPSLLAIQAGGGGSAGFYGTQPEDVRRQIDMKVGKIDKRFVVDNIKKAWELWHRIGAATEQANRVAIYDRVIANGGTKAEAAYQALDLLDFSQRGDYAAVRVLVEMIPFLNARIQGLYRLYRGAIKGSPTKPEGLNKQFLFAGTIIMGATLALAFANAANPEYDALEDWDKDTYWHFWIDGNHWRIPKPFEVGALFATMPERAYMLLTGKNETKDFAESVGRMFVDTFAVDIRPQLLKPMIEAWANRNSFTDSDIVPESMQDLLPEAQYSNNTSETARILGRAIPETVGDLTEKGLGFNLKSPLIIDHLVRGYVGELGTYVTEASDAMARMTGDYPAKPTPRISDMPVVSRFFRGDAPRTERFLQDFYDKRREVEQVVATIRRYQTSGDIDRARKLLADPENQDKMKTRAGLSTAYGAIADITGMMRTIQDNKTMSAERKREMIDRLIAQRNKVARMATEAAPATTNLMRQLSGNAAAERKLKQAAE